MERHVQAIKLFVFGQALSFTAPALSSAFLQIACKQFNHCKSLMTDCPAPNWMFNLVQWIALPYRQGSPEGCLIIRDLILLNQRLEFFFSLISLLFVFLLLFQLAMLSTYPRTRATPRMPQTMPSSQRRTVVQGAGEGSDHVPMERIQAIIDSIDPGAKTSKIRTLNKLYFT